MPAELLRDGAAPRQASGVGRPQLKRLDQSRGSSRNRQGRNPRADPRSGPPPGSSQATTLNPSASEASCGCHTRPSSAAPCTNTSAAPRRRTCRRFRTRWPDDLHSRTLRRSGSGRAYRPHPIQIQVRQMDVEASDHADGGRRRARRHPRPQSMSERAACGERTSAQREALRTGVAGRARPTTPSRRTRCFIAGGVRSARAERRPTSPPLPPAAGSRRGLSLR
jgi:hypothetical protein